jgi:hypothetical protein
MLWPFQIAYLLSIVGGLGAWVLLDRGDRLGDVGAMLCLLLAVGSNSLGIPVMLAVAVELAVRRQWRRGWLVAVPAFLYLLWYLGYGENQVTSESLIHAPGFAEDLAAAAFGGLTGRGLEWGRPLAVFGAVVVLIRLARPAGVSPRLAGLLVAAVSLWLLTATARSTISVPETSRYVYLGSALIVLAGVEMLHGRLIPATPIVLAIPLVALCAFSGLTDLHNAAQGLRGTSQTVTAELGALELAARYAPPEYEPDPALAPQIKAGLYLHTVRSIGSSPADTPSQILAASTIPRRQGAERARGSTPGAAGAGIELPVGRCSDRAAAAVGHRRPASGVPCGCAWFQDRRSGNRAASAGRHHDS